jgi:hypothetical protein
MNYRSSLRRKATFFGVGSPCCASNPSKQALPNWVQSICHSGATRYSGSQDIRPRSRFRGLIQGHIVCPWVNWAKCNLLHSDNHQFKLGCYKYVLVRASSDMPVYYRRALRPHSQHRTTLVNHKEMEHARFSLRRSSDIDSARLRVKSEKSWDKTNV